jgi:hypothetical protein
VGTVGRTIAPAKTSAWSRSERTWPPPKHGVPTRPKRADVEIAQATISTLRVFRSGGAGPILTRGMSFRATALTGEPPSYVACAGKVIVCSSSSCIDWWKPGRPVRGQERPPMRRRLPPPWSSKKQNQNAASGLHYAVFAVSCSQLLEREWRPILSMPDGPWPSKQFLPSGTADS